ncbi:hypothetical protein B0H19DRAFT_1250499 [Mycena capillaripes]|nr:hypothetical protein B0H19DRAFT_1250499 [Mycena capillaripes]
MQVATPCHIYTASRLRLHRQQNRAASPRRQTAHATFQGHVHSVNPPLCSSQVVERRRATTASGCRACEDTPPHETDAGVGGTSTHTPRVERVRQDACACSRTAAEEVLLHATLAPRVSPIRPRSQIMHGSMSSALFTMSNDIEQLASPMQSTRAVPRGQATPTLLCSAHSLSPSTWPTPPASSRPQSQYRSAPPIRNPLLLPFFART